MSGYDYEQLNDESFQELCQALLINEFPGLQCLPVGQRDGGRDAFAWRYDDADKELLVFQVKFVRDPARIAKPHTWLSNVVAKEARKIGALAERARIGLYVLITNVPGTAPLGSGSVDVVDSALDQALDIPTQCWWRADLDRRLDSEWDLKWRYPSLLTGTDFLRGIFESGVNEDLDRRHSAVRAFVTHQYDADREVKFKQIELQNDLVELFVDVPLTPVAREISRSQMNKRLRRFVNIASELSIVSDYESDWVGIGDDWHPEQFVPPLGASRLLLHEGCASNFPRIVLEGAPGQGKSTLAQFACQVHRIHLLGLGQEAAQLPSEFQDVPVRIPIKVDLRDYATWLSRRDPFDIEGPSLPEGWKKPLESFLAHQISHMAGGIRFDVADLHAVLRVSATLLVLDGLDEVADVKTRATLVNEVTSAIRRLEADSASVVAVVTSRPANFANSPGFSEQNFAYFELMPLTRALIDDYVEKWINAKNLNAKDGADVRRVVRSRMGEPHLRELARNPMQLAILLSVVHTRGASLPDKRTALYNLYVDIFFNREAEKDEGVRRHRELLIDIHGYVAWLLQTEAEAGGDGRISIDRLKDKLSDYLTREERDVRLVDELFREMAQRVLALVSRIEGTLEFEVQSLREYFAARYLYETAPPSPVGNEQLGSKPDRFDSLASNFYWLNVARFYAGFYQKGELPSLAQQLQELVEREEFKNTGHPRALAAALLADWVFSQNQRSMRQVIDLVTDGIGLGEIAPAPVGRRQGSELRLPEGNGRAELVERCFELLIADPPRELRIELCELLSGNADAAVLQERWEAALHDVSLQSSDAIVEWLMVGGYLGLRQKIAFGDIEATIGSQIADEKILLEIYRWLAPDIVERDPSVAVALIRAATAEWSYRPVAFGGESSDIQYVLSSLSVPLWANALGLSSGEMPLDEILRHSFRGWMGGDGNGSGEESSWPEPVDRLIGACREARSMNASAWARTLLPWDSIVSAGVEGWGEQPAFVLMASIGAGVRNREETGNDCDELFDRSKSLAQRLRYARLRAGAPGWWSDTLAAMRTDEDRELVLAAAMPWAGMSVIRSCVEGLNETIEAVDAKAFGTLVELLWLRALRRGRLSGTDLLHEDEIGDRLAVVIGMRSDRGTQIKVAQRLRERDVEEAWALRFRADVLQFGDRLTKEDWEELARLAERAYVDDVAIRFRQGLHNERMPVELAEGIASRPRDFPRAFVANAEAVCRLALGKKMTPVSEAAEKGQWFE